MDLLAEGLAEAVRLLLTFDAGTLEIAFLTLRVSGMATLLAAIVGIPLGALLAFGVFPGRGGILAGVNTGMALPPVVVGLVVSIMLWRSGPFGALGLIYTPSAMVIAQFVIAMPIIAGLATAGFRQLDPELPLQLRAMGASRTQTLWLLLRESRAVMLAAVMAGFGGAISEVGASLMVGGNILGQTRVLTTATALETSRGNFGTALALGLILLGLALLANAVLTIAQQRRA